MRVWLFTLCVVLGACSNGAVANCLGGGGGACCDQALVTRDVTYSGAGASGATVTVRVRSDRSATLTWSKGSQTVVQEFSELP